jgi:TRAP-type C4-dicarboxylate transport system permease small subunit
MSPRLVAIGRWLRRRAENIAAALMAVMFFDFLLQIVFRYIFNLPIGWTNEVSVICWLWLVLFGAAFVVTEAGEIRLDLVYTSSRLRVRRVMAAIAAITLVALFTVSLPAVIDYVSFMKVQRTAYLKIRFDWLYSAYIVFAVAMIIRYVWLGWHAIWGKTPEAYDPAKASSGL